MANLALAFDILARDRASATMNKVGRSSDGLGKKLAGVGKLGAAALATGIGVAAVGGVAALGAAMVQGVKDAADYQTLAAKTAAVLKSTGNAAHQSVKGIQARAGALESMSGVDETTIINGQNVLATFTKVQDRVGKGNDIFSRATAAALDMSTALGTDMQGSVIQLGKALNDPIKGVTALSRVGVSFTAAQKKQIRTLVDSGKTMEAQKLILKELNTEFGGAAKAAGKGFNGAMARAKDSVQDAFRAIGEKLLPILTTVADYVAEHAGPAIERISDAFSGLFSLFAKGDFTSAFKKAFHVDEDSTLVAFLFRLRDGFVAVVDFVKTKVIPAVAAFGGWLKNDLWPALKEGYQTIMPAIKQALKIVGDAFNGSGGQGKSFGDFIKGAGKIIVDYVIPILASMIKTWLPLLATEWRIIIEVIKKVWQAGQTLAAIWAGVIKGILRGFADMAGSLAAVLRALSHIPGFGWAKTAADKLQGAANKANDLARAIDNIQRNVQVNVRVNGSGKVTLPGGTKVDFGQYRARAKGGPVSAYGAYAVGDNPDGSWNPTTELFVPQTAGTVYNQKQLAAMSAGSGKTDLSEASLQRLAAIWADTHVNATVSAGSMDRAIGGTLR